MSSSVTKKIAIFTALIFLLLAGAALLRSDKKKSSTLIHTEAKAIADKSRLDLIENRGFSGNNFLILSQIAGKRGEDLNYLYHDIDFIFEENTKYCPNLDDPFLQNIRKSRQLICSRIVYKTSEHQTFSVLLKSDNKKNPRRLLVYNHGHGGLPGENDDFAYQMLNGFLSDGFDILFVSMPFTGIDKIGYDFQFDSWDGPSTASAKAIKNKAYYQHGIFELMDTGKSHFIRYFIDSAVVSTLMLRGEYTSIDYVGLSGGAHNGLYTCSILKNIVHNCVLVAGIMPINLRANFGSFGDAEQISSSFHKANNIFKIINELSASSTTLHLIYNDKDPCCFSGKVAKKFKSQLEEKSINVNFNIRHSNNHDYDPTEIKRIISY